MEIYNLAVVIYSWSLSFYSLITLDQMRKNLKTCNSNGTMFAIQCKNPILGDSNKITIIHRNLPTKTLETPMTQRPKRTKHENLNGTSFLQTYGSAPAPAIPSFWNQNRCRKGYVRFASHEEAVGLLVAFAEDDEEGKHRQEVVLKIPMTT